MLGSGDLVLSVLFSAGGKGHQFHNIFSIEKLTKESAISKINNIED